MAARGAAGAQAEPGTAPPPLASPGDLLPFAGDAAMPPRERAWAPGDKAGAGSGCHGLGAGLGTGKIVLNQCLGEAVVAGASRPGERWQEAAGSAELFLAAAGAGERASRAAAAAPTCHF